MSALADFAHKFGSESRELKIGQSFFNAADSVFHTIRYDFVPASVDPNKTSAVDFGQNGKVTVTMPNKTAQSPISELSGKRIPNLEGSGTTESVYQGQRKPHQKECVLIINNETGDMILEKLNTSMIVKKARLRQEDLTGKSLALNKNATLNGASTSTAAVSSNSLGQAKSSIGDKKGSTGGSSGSLKPSQNSSSTAKLQKQSPPLSSGTMPNSSSAQTRSNGFHPKTPSPPSMPIFSANKGSLLRMRGGGDGQVTYSTEPNADWSSLSKSKSQNAEPGKSTRNQNPVANRLSSSESSDGAISEEESSSSPSSDSSSEDEEMNSEKSAAATNSRSSALSMPSLSMPASLVALSALPDPVPNLPQSSSSDNVKSPPLVTATDLKKSASLSLSSESDSSDDETSRKDSKISNGAGFSKTVNNNKCNGKTDPTPKGSAFAPENKSFPDSKFSNGTSTASAFPSMPKYSQLSQDLQLSESGSDSDD